MDFPRTIPQAEALDAALCEALDEKMDYAIDVDVPDENIVIPYVAAEEPAPAVVRPTIWYTTRPRQR